MCRRRGRYCGIFDPLRGVAADHGDGKSEGDVGEDAGKNEKGGEGEGVEAKSEGHVLLA